MSFIKGLRRLQQEQELFLILCHAWGSFRFGGFRGFGA